MESGLQKGDSQHGRVPEDPRVQTKQRTNIGYQRNWEKTWEEEDDILAGTYIRNTDEKRTKGQTLGNKGGEKFASLLQQKAESRNQQNGAGEEQGRKVSKKVAPIRWPKGREKKTKWRDAGRPSNSLQARLEKRRADPRVGKVGSKKQGGFLTPRFWVALPGNHQDQGERRSKKTTQGVIEGWGRKKISTTRKKGQNEKKMVSNRTSQQPEPEEKPTAEENKRSMKGVFKTREKNGRPRLETVRRGRAKKRRRTETDDNQRDVREKKTTSAKLPPRGQEIFSTNS